MRFRFLPFTCVSLGLALACSSSSEQSANEEAGGAGGGSLGGSGSSTAGAGGNLAGGASSNGGVASTAWLTDSSVPGCTISDQAADLRIRGMVAGQAVDMRQIPSSYISLGQLQLLGSHLTDAGYQPRDDLLLRWTGSLTPGVVTKLNGGTFVVTVDQPGGDKEYCFSEGEIAPVDSGVPGDTGRLFKFRLRVFKLNANCSGSSVEGSLTGCIHRLYPQLE